MFVEMILDQNFLGGFGRKFAEKKLNFISIGVFSIYGKILLAHFLNIQKLKLIPFPLRAIR
jgi:hypothetical protein